MELVTGLAIVSIEIKSYAYEPRHPSDAIEKQIVEMVKRHSARDEILISSFDINILDQLFTIEDPPAIALISKSPASNRIVEICTHL